MTPKTILLFANTAFSIVNFRGAIIRRLISNGIRVVIVSPPGIEAEAKLTSMGCEFVPFTFRSSSMKFIGVLLDAYVFLNLIRRYNPDAVVSYTAWPITITALCRLFGFFLPLAFVCFVTGLGFSFINQGWKSAIYRLVFRLAVLAHNRIWLLNKEDLETLFGNLQLSRGRIDILPGEGFEIGHYHVVDFPKKVNGTTTFIFIGRLLIDKGIEEFLYSAQSLKSRYGEHVRFVVCGTTDRNNPNSLQDSYFETEAARGYFDYFGFLTDIRPAIAAADVVVLPSYREGMPFSLMEGAAMGRPIIATNVPGCRNLVLDGISGLLCEPRDKESLLQKMEIMHLYDLEILYRYGSKGRELIESEYSFDKVMPHYLKLVN
jgi:glycosyltransferase involved in cell wall biosynthesis